MVTNNCQAFHQLPRAGGVLDQDAFTMLGMQLVMEAQEDRREMERKSNEAKQQAKQRQKGR